MLFFRVRIIVAIWGDLSFRRYILNRLRFFTSCWAVIIDSEFRLIKRRKAVRVVKGVNFGV